MLEQVVAGEREHAVALAQDEGVVALRQGRRQPQDGVDRMRLEPREGGADVGQQALACRARGRSPPGTASAERVLDRGICVVHAEADGVAAGPSGAP